MPKRFLVYLFLLPFLFLTACSENKISSSLSTSSTSKEDSSLASSPESSSSSVSSAEPIVPEKTFSTIHELFSFLEGEGKEILKERGVQYNRIGKHYETSLYSIHETDVTEEGRSYSDSVLTGSGTERMKVTYDYKDPEETSDTFEGNSKIKAEDIASQCQDIAVLADDSGLSILALDGFPGVHSARFMEGHSYLEKNRAILEKMEKIEDRRASFLTVMTYIDEKRETEKCFLGEDKGEIIRKLKEEKQNGFGYDPIFYSYALKKTYGEASPEEKNSVSHRGRALKKLVAYLGGER